MMKKAAMLALASFLVIMSGDAIAQVAAGQAARSPVVLGNRPALADAALNDMARALSGRVPANAAATGQATPAGAAVTPQQQGAQAQNGQALAAEANILRFDSMVGISGGLVGTDLIRGVPGGGAPWTVGSATGTLSQDGQLNITVQGLVLTDSGINPAASFGAILSCQDSDGNPVNIPTTGDFPTDEQGNATISETLTIATPCFAPIIFVTGPEGQWFAATGLMGSAAPVLQGAALTNIVNQSTLSGGSVLPVTATQAIDPSVTATQLSDSSVTANPNSPAPSGPGTAAGTTVISQAAVPGQANTGKSIAVEDRVKARNKPEDNKKLIDDQIRLVMENAKFERKELKDAGKKIVERAKEEKKALKKQGLVEDDRLGNGEMILQDQKKAIVNAPEAADNQAAKPTNAPIVPVAAVSANIAPSAAIEANAAAPGAKASASATNVTAAAKSPVAPSTGVTAMENAAVNLNNLGVAPNPDAAAMDNMNEAQNPEPVLAQGANQPTAVTLAAGSAMPMM